jgi:hypothetical protein
MRIWLAVAGVVLALAGCGGNAPAATPSPTPEPTAVPVASGAAGVRASATSGRFELVLEVRQAVYRTTDPVTGWMTLRVRDPQTATLGATKAGPLAMTFAQVGGSARMTASFDADCAEFTVSPSDPYINGLRKPLMFSFSRTDPNGPLYRAFLADPEIHLPPGQWDVSAVALFAEGGCTGASVSHSLQTTTRITVTE